jgi:hypothetical protein
VPEATLEVLDVEGRTRISCALPHGYPFVLHLVAHDWNDREHLDARAMIDVVVGDEAFDRRFRIEGAPADVVKRVLDPEMRAWFLSESGIELHASDGRARLVVDRVLKRADDARAVLALLERFAAAVRTATHALDEGLGVQSIPGAPYRDEARDDRLQASRAARAAEVEQLLAVRAGRERTERYRALGFVVLLVLVLMLVVFVQHLSIY